ncbi:hypothetical protein HDV05_000954 [Chytridiales sp. JEL 0842]|nr:hypothetical protein HDV05_000954 [Chytridiales sp. JEL 0842]
MASKPPQFWSQFHWQILICSPLFPLIDITVPTPTSSRIEFKEPITGERLSLSLIDTPGLPKTDMIVHYINAQYEAALGLTPIDRYALNVLTNKVNVIPCLGKSDLLTIKQFTQLRNPIMQDLRANDIHIVALPEDPDVEYEPETLKLNTDLRELLPFAIINDKELDPLLPADEMANLNVSATNPMRKAGGPLGRKIPMGHHGSGESGTL